MNEVANPSNPARTLDELAMRTALATETSDEIAGEKVQRMPVSVDLKKDKGAEGRGGDSGEGRGGERKKNREIRKRESERASERLRKGVL